MMSIAELGDRVQVHYVKRLQDGTVASSRKRAPVELTVGIDHPRLPGLGLALIGLAPGGSTTIRVPSELAYGPSDPTRVHRWARTRFPNDRALSVGKCVRIGYKPWREVRGESLWDYHQTCVRAVRADYGGDGTGYTRNGTLVDISDRLGI